MAGSVEGFEPTAEVLEHIQNARNPQPQLLAPEWGRSSEPLAGYWIATLSDGRMDGRGAENARRDTPLRRTGVPGHRSVANISMAGNFGAWLEMPANIAMAAPTVSASTHQRRGLLPSAKRM